MFFINLADDDQSGFVLGFGRDFEKVRIVPQSLSFNEVYAVFGEIPAAFSRVELKSHNGIEIIPLRERTQASARLLTLKISCPTTAADLDLRTVSGLLHLVVR